MIKETGSFLTGLFLGRGASTTIYNNHHNTTIIRNPIQYPDDWDNYTDEGKLEWLKNRCYWHEYYELKHSLYERVEFKLIEDDNIYYKVIDSIIKNKGDKTEAEQLFTEYLNKKYAFKRLDNTTITEIKMEVDRMNDYIQYNYPLIPHLYRSVEYYYFNVRMVE